MRILLNRSNQGEAHTFSSPVQHPQFQTIRPSYFKSVTNLKSTKNKGKRSCFL